MLRTPRLFTFAAATSLALLSAPAAKTQTFISFDVPGGTLMGVTGINAMGAVIGNYMDQSTLMGHGFLRSLQGTFTQIDPPDSIGVVTLKSINDSGAITGWYVNSSAFLYQGFVRTPEGVYAVFSPPLSVYTQPVSINANGAITGYYNDGITYFYHGLLRDSAGAFTEFDPPGSTNTVPLAINAKGIIAGYYSDTNGTHGFIRDPQGAFTSFDVPGIAIRSVSINAGARSQGRIFKALRTLRTTDS